MREIKISLETATRWYNGTDAELKELAINTYPELAVKELPKNWEELVKVKGYYSNSDCDVQESNIRWTRKSSKNIFKTYEQAEASIAMAQLSQLMAVYNDGWVADYNDINFKYAIFYYKEKIKISDINCGRTFLTFKDKETAELFLHNFKDLILTAKPLL
jgi:hypothetical protein